MLGDLVSGELVLNLVIWGNVIIGAVLFTQWVNRPERPREDRPN